MSTGASDELALFAAAGVRVVPVEDFVPKVAWVRDLGLLVIDSNLTTEERRQVARDYLPLVLMAPAANQ